MTVRAWTGGGGSRTPRARSCPSPPGACTPASGPTGAPRARRLRRRSRLAARGRGGGRFPDLPSTAWNACSGSRKAASAGRERRCRRSPRRPRARRRAAGGRRGHPARSSRRPRRARDVVGRCAAGVGGRGRGGCLGRPAAAAGRHRAAPQPVFAQVTITGPRTGKARRAPSSVRRAGELRGLAAPSAARSACPPGGLRSPPSFIEASGRESLGLGAGGYWIPSVDGLLEIRAGDGAPGRPLDPRDGPFEVDPEEEGWVNELVRRRLPSFSPTPLRSETCIYTMTPDQDFVLDRSGPDRRRLRVLGARLQVRPAARRSARGSRDRRQGGHAGGALRTSALRAMMSA